LWYKRSGYHLQRALAVTFSHERNPHHYKGALLMIRILLATILAIASGISPALAQSVLSNVEGINAGVFASNPQGPSKTTVESGLTFPGTSTLDFAATGFGQATQRPDGVGAVAADAIFVNGQTGNYIEARTLWTESADNTSGAPADYVFDFSITPASLRIVDFAGLPDASNNAVDVSFQITIRANGAVVFEAGASVFGGNISHTLTETGTSLNPTFVAGSVFGYDFAPYSDVLALGTVPNGGTITIEYEMVARVDTPGFEAGGRAEIGDPFDLSGTPGLSGTLRPAGPIPTQAASWGAIKTLYR
jgi:hypothetical protein